MNGKTNNSNQVFNIHKILKPLPGIVLGTMMLIGGLETIQFSRNPESTIVLGSKSANAQSNRMIALERSVHGQINQYRRSRGLKPLKLDRNLMSIARNHSQRMAAKGVLVHSGINLAENVAYNYGNRYPSSTAVNGWIKSSGHHKNIVGRYKATGIGVAKNSKGQYFFTQVFR